MQLHLALGARELLSCPRAELPSPPRGRNPSAARLDHLWSIRLGEVGSGFTMSDPPQSQSRRGVLSGKGSLGSRLSKRLSSKADTSKMEDDLEEASEATQLTLGASRPEHLIILANGIWGSVKNWIFAAKELKEKLGDKVVVHCSTSNGGLKTHSGVDIMGTRLAKEVMEKVQENPGVSKISFVSHSLGGLISRYAIGLLYAPPGGHSLLEERSEASTSDSDAGRSRRGQIGAPFVTHEQGTIAGLEPVNFITLATPHLGCRGNNHLPFLFGRAALEWAAPLVSPLIIGLTGRHLFLADGNKTVNLFCSVWSWIPRKADSYQACDALKDGLLMQMFPTIMVGWRTASIRKISEMPEPLQEPKEDQKHLSKYKYIVRVEEVPLAVKDSSENGGAEPKDAPALDPIEEAMVAGLQQVPWQRVDVNFSKTDSLHEAHNLIQVKSFPYHGEGKYVIHHIIDNYF